MKDDVAQMLENEKRKDEALIGGIPWRELKVKLKSKSFDISTFIEHLEDNELNLLEMLEDA